MPRTKLLALIVALLLIGAVSNYYSHRPKTTVALDEALAACDSLPNNSIAQVTQTSRMFIKLPESFYPKDVRSYFATASGNATAGYVSNGGLPGEAMGAPGGCSSTYFDFEGTGEVDLRVKSLRAGTPDYFVKFIVR